MFQTVCFYKLLKKNRKWLKRWLEYQCHTWLCLVCHFFDFCSSPFLRHLLSFPDGRIANWNLFVQLTQIRFQLGIEGNPQILRFCLTSILTGPKRFTPLFQPIKPRTKTNLLRFPALKAFCVSLIWILTGSS